MSQPFSLSLLCAACLINFPYAQFLVEAYSRAGIRSDRLRRKKLVGKLEDVEKRLILKSTEKCFEPLTSKDIEEAFLMAGGCLIGIDRQPELHQSATFADHFQRALSNDAGPLYQSLWVFMRSNPTNSAAEERIAHGYIAALQPSTELLGIWEKLAEEDNADELKKYTGSYNLALRYLGKLDLSAEGLRGVLSGDKANEFEFEERAVPLLGVKCFPWEFMGLMNKAHPPSTTAALFARFSEIPPPPFFNL